MHHAHGRSPVASQGSAVLDRGEGQSASSLLFYLGGKVSAWKVALCGPTDWADVVFAGCSHTTNAGVEGLCIVRAYGSPTYD